MSKNSSQLTDAPIVDLVITNTTLYDTRFHTSPSVVIVLFLIPICTSAAEVISTTSRNNYHGKENNVLFKARSSSIFLSLRLRMYMCVWVCLRVFEGCMRVCLGVVECSFSNIETHLNNP